MEKNTKHILIRVYTDDKKCDLNNFLAEYSGHQDISGLTVFRGIAGFGPHHQLHTVNLVDLSMDLPIVIECIVAEHQAEKLIKELHQRLEKAHIISWPVELYF